MLLSDRLISDNTIKNLYKSANHSKKPVYYDEQEDDDDLEVDDDADADDSYQDGDDEEEKFAHNEKSATTNSYLIDASLKSHSKNKSLSSSISSTSTSSYSSSISTHNNLNSNLYEFKGDSFDKKQPQPQSQQQQQTNKIGLIKPIAYLPKENPSYFSSLKPSPESKPTAFQNKKVCSSTNDILNSKAVRNNLPSQQASKFIDRLISAQENENSSNKQPTSLSYTCQAYNSSRLSSYDNHDFKEALANIQSLNQNNCNNSNIDKMIDNYSGNNFHSSTNDVQQSSLNNSSVNNGTLQPSLLGKYGRKRASIAFPSIGNQANTIKHGSSSVLFSSNKSTSSNNIFARALNYAKKSSSSSSSSSSTNTQNNKLTWKNKLTKYLSNSSSKSNGLNKRADSQEGCDIIIDEDMFSSYHLSRRQPSSVINVSTATSHVVNNTANINNNNNNTLNTTNIKSNSNNMTSDEMNNAFKNSANRKKAVEKKPKSKSLVPDMIDIPKKDIKSDQSTASSSSTAGFFSTNNFTNKSIINNGFNSLRKILKFNTNSTATQGSKKVTKYKTKQFASTSVLSVPNLGSSTDLTNNNNNNKLSKINVNREALTLDELKSAHTSKSSTNSSMSTSLSIPNETSPKQQQQQQQQTSQNVNTTTIGKEGTPFSSPSTSSASAYSSKNQSTPNNENIFQALSCIDAAIDASINKLSVKNSSNSKLFDSCKPIKSISIFNNKKDSSELNTNNSVSNSNNNKNVINNNKQNNFDNNLNKSNSKTFCFKKNLLLNNQFSCIKNEPPHNHFNDNSTQSTSTLSASYVKPKPSLIDTKNKQVDNLNSNSSSSTCYQQSTKSKSYETNEKFPFNKAESGVVKSKPSADDDLLCDLEVASFFDRYNTTIRYEDSNYVDNYDDDDNLQTFDAFEHPNDNVNNEFFVDSSMNSAYVVQNKAQANNIKKLMSHENELENLDYLVRQLAVEANLTNLANSSVFAKATVPFQKHQPSSKLVKKCNNYDNANLNTFISDLDVEHLVDDLNKQLNDYSHKDVDSFSDEDNQEDEDDEENDDLETDNDSIEFEKIIEIFDKNPISNGASEYSTTSSNTKLNNTNVKKFDSSSLMRRPVEQQAQPRKELKSMIDETEKHVNQSRHKRSSSTVSNNSITIKPHFSTKLQFNNYPIKPKENNKPNKFNSSLTIYPQTPSKLNNSNYKSNTLQQAEKHIVFNKIQPLTDFNFNNIKIEKKIKLNYRKPQNLNSLLNFGTLC